MPPPDDAEDKEIIVEPKELTVLLHITGTEGAIRCLEQVGSNLLSDVIKAHAAIKDDVNREHGTLIDPIGTDIYRVSKEYVMSIRGMLEIKVDILEQIADNDVVSLIIVS